MRPLIALCLSALLAVDAAPHALTVPYELAVKRYATVPMGQNRVDQMLAEATRVVARSDATGDAKADVLLRRTSVLDVFSVGSGTIASPSDFNAIFDPRKDPIVQARIVRAISFCGSPLPGIIGCADEPGYRLAVVDEEDAYEGILWAHEFGHTRGLDHRDEDYAVMHSVISLDNKQLLDYEARMYEGSAIRAAIRRQQPARKPQNVVDFVRRLYVHGVPFEEASRFSPAVVDTLVPMLRSRDARWASNIVAVLGASGDERAFKPIVSVIEAPPDKETPREYRAKISGLIALGHLANRIPTSPAYGYLREHALPQNWRRSQRPLEEGEASRLVGLASTAALAIALSGSDDAERFLIDLQSRADITDVLGTRTMLPALADAQRVAQQVRSLGLAGYYRSARPR